MGLFNIFKKSSDQIRKSPSTLIYNLLFCDDLELYKTHNQQPNVYPWDILFSDPCNISDLQKIINDPSIETRVKILTYNKLRALGQTVENKELLAVIVEVGLEAGLDVLASFRNGTARYINQSGKMIIWETTDETSNAFTNQLFRNSENVVKQIGPWNKPRRPQPAKGVLRITFLVSDGLYFGEGPVNDIFNDAFIRPALISATALMKYLTETAMMRSQ